MANRVFDKDPEAGRVPRCRIPQDELTDPFAVAEKYDFNTVQDAFLFKERAVQGALELSAERGPLKSMHLYYADSITKQMRVLVEAQALMRHGKD